MPWARARWSSGAIEAAPVGRPSAIGERRQALTPVESARDRRCRVRASSGDLRPLALESLPAWLSDRVVHRHSAQRDQHSRPGAHLVSSGDPRSRGRNRNTAENSASASLATTSLASG